MSELSQLTPEQEPEYEAYGDGVEVGIKSVLRDLKRAYQSAPTQTQGLTALYDVCKRYGVDLDKVKTVEEMQE